ncbi:MAG: hypothetical protein LBR39_08055 [Coriobacteriales bacterium]|jgi:2-keto-3-deoxy-L-rhamnonate aldolase RhmA|nr:hypothetical protein [Coriobacteriales bacterium]
MNATEKQMFELLKELRDNYGVLAVKAEFEAEGSRTDELVLLTEIVFRANMNLTIKIGGCEAVRDLYQCRHLGANGIMAPMIESSYAMKKFRETASRVYADCSNEIEWIINTETMTCLKNIDGILAVADGFLDTIVIGRVDLSGSLHLPKSEVNNERMMEISKEFANKAKAHKMRIGVGGE